jgi:hypothetical protein
VNKSVKVGVFDKSFGQSADKSRTSNKHDEDDPLHGTIELSNIQVDDVSFMPAKGGQNNTENDEQDNFDPEATK